MKIKPAIKLLITCAILFFAILKFYGKRKPIFTSTKTVCIVLTTEKHLLSRGVAVWNTWGQDFIQKGELVFGCNCKNVMKLKEMLRNDSIVSIPDELSEYLPVVHFPILQVDVLEMYLIMGTKCMVILKEAFKLYTGKAVEWWYMVDDDAYVFVDNLFKFISRLNSSEPFLYGFHFTNFKPSGYALGGSGIIFTNESMTRLVKKINQDGCKEYYMGYGDIMISRCAYPLGIRVNNSIDQSGRQRFHAENPYTHFYGPLASKYQTDTTHSGKLGKECCSVETIAFHYINTTLMYQMHSNKNFLVDMLTHW